MDGALENREEVIYCKNLLVNFDLLQMTGRKSHNFFFEEGFMRIGDRVSPPSKLYWQVSNFNKWKQTKVPAPASCTELTPKKTVLFSSNLEAPANPAIVLRKISTYLQELETLGLSCSDVLLLYPHLWAPPAIKKLITQMFDVTGIFDEKNIKKLSGTYLLSEAIFSRLKSPGWQRRDVSELTRKHLLASFGIAARNHCSSVDKITLISRQDHKVDESYINFTSRKISNEDEIIAALTNNFPDSEVNKVSMENLAMEEQLRQIHGTDILVGMHGAGLAFTVMLPPNAGVLELFPAYFLLPHYFRTFYPLAANDRKHYRRWINLNPKREFLSKEHADSGYEKSGSSPTFEPPRDFVKVPPQAVVKKIKVLQRQIRKNNRI